MIDTTIHIVSGFMRTGSSMMMKALEAGGLEAARSEERDALKNQFKDEHYDPNIGGLYELNRTDYTELNFPNKFQGKLIKVLQQGVVRMNVTPGSRVVFMRRDQEEIRQSFLAFFNSPIESPLFDEHFQYRQDLIIEQIRNRKDILSVDVMWYRDVIANPLKAFRVLQSSGWRIDAEKAAAVVDPELLRYKREELTEGVL